MFQTPNQIQPLNRGDHIWFHYNRRGMMVFKCCLCGGLTKNPPGYPTAASSVANWTPELGYERLTEEERSLAPNPVKQIRMS